MSRTFEKIQRDADRAMDIFRLPGKTAEAMVYTLAGEPALPKIRRAAVDSFWNAALFGPRVLRDVAVGVLKGTLKLTWNMIKLLPLPLPMLDSWKKERGDVAMRTKDALELFKFDNKFPPLLSQKREETPHALAA